MKRRQLESLLSALIPTLRHFIERQIETAKTAVKSAVIAELPKPKDGEDGKSVTIEDVEPLVSALVDRKVPSAKDVATLVIAGIELPTGPAAEDVAKLVQIPAAPTLEDIVASVMSKLTIPTAKEIAAEVPVPTVELPDVPTAEAIIAMISPQLPSAKAIADEVRVDVLSSIEIPQIPELPELPEIPSAEQIAKLVVPMLPEPPSVGEIVDQLKKHIPAPVKGDKGDTGTIDMEAVATMLEGFFSKRWLEFERRANDALTKFIESIEKPRDGIDGFGFDDMRVEHDGERHFEIIFERADKPTKKFPFDLPIAIYRGVWKSGDDYVRGDSVTWDGCTWIAKNETQDKPGQSDSWQLAVKKGRDGRDGDVEPKKQPTRVRVAPRVQE